MGLNCEICKETSPVEDQIKYQVRRSHVLNKMW